jgi:CRISPR-associated protein Csa3
LVASFGFDERFVVRAVIRHGIGSGDRIVLVTGSRHERTVKAFEYVRGLAESVGAEAELVEMGDVTYSFPGLVARLRSLLEGLAGAYERVTVLLSGGMRVLVLALYTAALLSGRGVKGRLRVEVDTEDVGRLVEIPGEALSLLGPPELGAKMELLRAVVERPGLTVEELASMLSKNPSTIRRQVAALDELSLVRLHGRPARVEPTGAAIMLLGAK